LNSTPLDGVKKLSLIIPSKLMTMIVAFLYARLRSLYVVIDQSHLARNIWIIFDEKWSLKFARVGCYCKVVDLIKLKKNIYFKCVCVNLNSIKIWRNVSCVSCSFFTSYQVEKEFVCFASMNHITNKLKY